MQQPRLLPARQEVHLHFHGISAEDVAAILARVNREDPGRVDPRKKFGEAPHNPGVSGLGVCSGLPP